MNRLVLLLIPTFLLTTSSAIASPKQYLLDSLQNCSLSQLDQN